MGTELTSKSEKRKRGKFPLYLEFAMKKAGKLGKTAKKKNFSLEAIIGSWQP